MLIAFILPAFTAWFGLGAPTDRIALGVLSAAILAGVLAFIKEYNGSGFSDTLQAYLMLATFLIPAVGAWLGLGAPTDRIALGVLAAAVSAGILVFIKEYIGSKFSDTQQAFLMLGTFLIPAVDAWLTLGASTTHVALAALGAAIAAGIVSFIKEYFGISAPTATTDSATPKS
jgi:hypothetical protein